MVRLVPSGQLERPDDLGEPFAGVWLGRWIGQVDLPRPACGWASGALHPGLDGVIGSLEALVRTGMNGDRRGPTGKLAGFDVAIDRDRGLHGEPSLQIDGVAKAVVPRERCSGRFDALLGDGRVDRSIDAPQGIGDIVSADGLTPKSHLP